VDDKLAVLCGDVVTGVGATLLDAVHDLLHTAGERIECLAWRKVKTKELVPGVVACDRLVGDVACLDRSPYSNGGVERGAQSNDLLRSESEGDGTSSALVDVVPVVYGVLLVLGDSLGIFSGGLLGGAIDNIEPALEAEVGDDLGLSGGEAADLESSELGK